MTTLLRLLLIASVAAVASANNRKKMKSIAKETAVIFSTYARTRDPNVLNEFKGSCASMFIQANDVSKIISHLDLEYITMRNRDNDTYRDVWTMVQKDTLKTMYCSVLYTFTSENDSALKNLELDCPICDFETIPIPEQITTEKIMEIVDKNSKIYASQRDAASAAEIYKYVGTRYYWWQKESHPHGMRYMDQSVQCYDYGRGVSVSSKWAPGENYIPNYIRNNNISSITSKQEGDTLFWTLTRNDTQQSMDCTLEGHFDDFRSMAPRVTAFYFKCPYCHWNEIK